MQNALSQIKSASAVMALAFGEGMAIGWNSPALEKFENNEAPFTVTTDQMSWIVGMFDLGMMVGAWISALVFTQAGRRQTIMVGPTAMLLWILLLAFATSPAYVMVAQLLGGAGQGIVLSFVFLYVGEIASAELRGVLILIVSMLMPSGQLVAYLYGPNVNYYWQAVAPLPVVIAVYLCIFTWMEETPFYLAMRGQRDEMLRVLRKLRVGVPDSRVEKEAEAIREAVEQQLQEAGSWREVFQPPGVKRGACLVLVVSGSFAAVGIPTVLSYTTQIFDAAGTPIDTSAAASYVIAFEVVAVGAATFLIERLGRRLQLTLASLVNTVAMGGMCLFMIAKTVLKMDTTSVSYVPLVLMVLYISATGIGANTVPQILMSELLSQRVKALLAPIVMTIISLTSFLSDKYFTSLGENPGYYVPFGFFAAANLFIGIFTWFLVPETRGKTLPEVQDILRGNNKEKSAEVC